MLCVLHLFIVQLILQIAPLGLCVAVGCQGGLEVRLLRYLCIRLLDSSGGFGGRRGSGAMCVTPCKVQRGTWARGRGQGSRGK